MSFQHKLTWVNLVVTILVVMAYAMFIGSQIASTPVTAIAYQLPMILAIVAMVVLTIVGTIAMAIGTAITGEITGEGSVDEIDREDERDRAITARGERVAFYVSSALMLGVLAITMLGAVNFWIANALFAAMIAGGITQAIAKLVSYHRGF